MRTRLATAIGLALALLATGPARADDKEARKLLGDYTIVRGEEEGKPSPDRIKDSKVTIDEERITTRDKDNKEVYVIKYKLDTGAKPWKIDLTVLGGPEGARDSRATGVIGTEGDDTVVLVYGFGGGKSPTSLTDKTGPEQHKFVLKRAEKK